MGGKSLKKSWSAESIEKAIKRQKTVKKPRKKRRVAQEEKKGLKPFLFRHFGHS